MTMFYILIMCCLQKITAKKLSAPPPVMKRNILAAAKAAPASVPGWSQCGARPARPQTALQALF